MSCRASGTKIASPVSICVQSNVETWTPSAQPTAAGGRAGKDRF